MAQIVLVGGPTGIGKSRFIDSIVKDRSKYSRPISYTTRHRRVDDNRHEYEYVNFEGFEELRVNGLFVTVDKIYGNYYAMSHKSISEIIKSGKIVIKEIHPKNHAKIKSILPEVISIIILPKNPEEFWKEIKNNTKDLSQDRILRLAEDQEFYQSANFFSHPFDIVIFADDTTALNPDLLREDFVYNLIKKVPASALDIKNIETKNKLGYDLIAEEFADDKRITTANFHDLSNYFFKSQIKQYSSPTKSVLDLGTGRGYLIPILQESFTTIVVTDLSPKMLSFIKQSSGLLKVISSAFDLPFADNSFDLVVSSLADPFLKGEALKEVLRILVDGGIFIFSSPSKIWSDAIRQENHTAQTATKFIHSSGLEAEVYSFTYTNDELQQLIASYGFQIETFETAYGRELKNHCRTISPALTEAANKLNINFDDLPILQLVTARKFS